MTFHLQANLQRNLTYPLHAYVKENGYLGIIGLDTASNDLFITSKSDITGDYALWFKELFLKKTTAETRENMIEYIKEHDVTCLFEVVDIEHDPHIIDYDESEIYLLDIVKNDLHFSKLDYNELFAIASLFSLKCKKLAYTINSWNDFLKWNEMISSQDYKYRGKYIEGFVIEDSSGFMFKKKCDYYRNWKLLRGIKDRILAGHAVNYDSLTKEQCDFCDFVKTLKDKENLNPNICHLRKIFYESRKQ